MTTAGSTAPQTDWPTLAAKVAFLQRPDAYPDRPARVEAVETHLSWVFLTTDRVYKLKKPVTHEHADLSMLAARERNSREELRLNRRLAPDVYLDAVPLTHTSDGTLHLGGGDIPVDWLVVMKRLPQASSLQARLSAGLASPDDIVRIVDRLVPFYRVADRLAIAPAAYARRFKNRIARDCDHLRHPTLGLPAGRILDVKEQAVDFVERHADLLRARAAEGRIVEAHGDLRPEHVFLMPEPVIIDCLEFSRQLRLLDPAEELGYLALECAHLGADWVGAVLLDAYRSRSGDPAPGPLVAFYQCRRALLRMRLAMAHLGDAPVPDPSKWRRQALGFLALAEACARASID